MSHSTVAHDDSKTFAILTDTTKCTGCETCVAACKTENKLGQDQAWKWQQEIDAPLRHTLLHRPAPPRSQLRPPAMPPLPRTRLRLGLPRRRFAENG